MSLMNTKNAPALDRANAAAVSPASDIGPDFKEHKTVLSAVEDIRKVGDNDYVKAATKLRTVKRSLVASIIIAYAEASKPNASHTVKEIIADSREKFDYPTSTPVKHDEFGLFVRACLSGPNGVASFNKDNPAVITQLVDDAFVVHTGYDDPEELRFGNEMLVTDRLTDNGYSYYKDKLRKPLKSSSRKQGTSLIANLGKLVRSKETEGKDLRDLIAQATDGEEIVLVTANGLMRVIMNSGAATVTKAVSCDEVLLNKLNSVLKDVG